MSYAYDNEEFSRYYDAFVAEHVSPDVYWTDTLKQIYTDVIQRTFVDNQCAIVVELGCGTGENLIYLQNYFKDKNVKFIGIDHSEPMLTRAREKLTNQTNNSIEFLHGNLTNFSECLGTKLIDCILLPAGTYHHLITDDERQQFLTNIQRTLRPETGLFLLYLLPDLLIHIDATPDPHSEDKFQLISTENIQQTDGEWICKQIFQFDVPPKIELSWQLRTCIISKLIKLYLSNNFEVSFCCLNGKELRTYNNDVLSTLNHLSTPVILIFSNKKINTN